MSFDINLYNAKARAAFMNKDLPGVFEVGGICATRMMRKSALEGDIQVFSQGKKMCLLWVVASLLGDFYTVWSAVDVITVGAKVWMFALVSFIFFMYCWADFCEKKARELHKEEEKIVEGMRSTLKELGVR